MKLLSIEYVPGQEIEALGLVKGTIVQTKNVGRDIMAGMKTLVGGEIAGYTQMLNEARQIATKRMVDAIAKELGLTTLKFNTIEQLVEAIGLPKCQVCTHCFDGSSKYTLEELADE